MYLSTFHSFFCVFIFVLFFLASEIKGKGIDTITSPAVSIVTTTLQLVLLLEEWRSSCLRHVSMASRIARLMCVFLTGKVRCHTMAKTTSES